MKQNFSVLRSCLSLGNYMDGMWEVSSQVDIKKIIFKITISLREGFPLIKEMRSDRCESSPKNVIKMVLDVVFAPTEKLY